MFMDNCLLDQIFPFVRPLAEQVYAVDVSEIMYTGLVACMGDPGLFQRSPEIPVNIYQ